MTHECSEEETIFDQAIRIDDPLVRAGFLDDACRGNTCLRESLQKLVACHDTAGDYLETPLVPSPNAAENAVPGGRIDRYQLIERIGEGGCGIVYRALQLAPLRRDVALKIVRLGMDTEEVVRRFNAERQVLSMMNHPHVASVLDAGATESGRPYFVMELVDGEPIDAFCDRHRLPIPKLLSLFLDVCHGVQHAHQKGIVHRDLKPSNVIVILHETRPIPKVIDFGIAKALWTSPDEHWHRTGEYRILGTPAYMSPEQMACDADIDTRADVYALGGILYKLLVGVDPIDTQQLKKVDLSEAYRLVRDETTKRPSVRLRSLPALEQQHIATLRHSHAGVLCRTLAGDLDWIVMRALEKDRARRYATVQELVADVERFLRHEPVSAGPPTLGYRLRKFARRNRIATMAGMLVAVSVFLGVVLSAIGFVQAKRQWQRAERQRDVAVAEADKAQQTLGLLEQMIGASHPEQGHPPDYTLRQLLENFSGTFETEMSNQPEIAARLHRTVGRAYWSLGNMERAGKHLTRALALYSQRFGPDHHQTAQARVDHALYLLQVSRVIAAQQAASQALVVLRQHPADEQTVWAQFALAAVHREYGEHAAVLECLQEAKNVAAQVLGAQAPLTLLMEIRVAQSHLAMGNFNDADRMSREVLDRLVNATSAADVCVAEAKRIRAVVLSRTGRHTEAESLAREALEIHRRQLGADNNKVVHDLIALSSIIHRSGRHEDAVQVAQQAVDDAERVTVERDRLRLRAYKNLASLLEFVRPEEAARIYTKAISSTERVLGPHAEVVRLMYRQAGLFVRLERFTEAAKCYQQTLLTIDQCIRSKPSKDVPTGVTDNGMETVYFATALDLFAVLIELDRMSETQSLADQIRLRASGLNSELGTVVVEIAEARGYLADGELSKAEDAINTALGMLERVPVWQIRIRAAIVRGAILIELKEFDQAQRVLQRTYRTARRRVDSNYDHLEYAVARQLAVLFETLNRPAKAAFWADRANAVEERAE